MAGGNEKMPNVSELEGGQNLPMTDLADVSPMFFFPGCWHLTGNRKAIERL